MTRDDRRLLYWQGFSVPQIAEMLQTKRPTVQSWKHATSGRKPHRLTASKAP
jgi:uncharacterized protein YjcR